MSFFVTTTVVPWDTYQQTTPSTSACCMYFYNLLSGDICVLRTAPVNDCSTSKAVYVILSHETKAATAHLIECFPRAWVGNCWDQVFGFRDSKLQIYKHVTLFEGIKDSQSPDVRLPPFFLFRFLPKNPRPEKRSFVKARCCLWDLDGQELKSKCSAQGSKSDCLFPQCEFLDLYAFCSGKMCLKLKLSSVLTFFEIHR